MAARGCGVFAYCALALVSAGGVSGCVDDGVSLHVTCPVVPTVDNGVCTFDPEADTCVLEGVMNVLATTTYNPVLSVQSGLSYSDTKYGDQNTDGSRSIRD